MRQRFEIKPRDEREQLNLIGTFFNALSLYKKKKIRVMAKCKVTTQTSKIQIFEGLVDWLELFLGGNF